MAKDQHWADGLAERWVSRKGKEQMVEIGWSPSGSMHVGFLREMVLGDVLFRALQDAGAKARFIFFVDSYDPLRDREADGKSWYKFLPESFRRHVGKPVFTIPDPTGAAGSYVEHFFGPVKEYMQILGVDPEIHFSHEAYKAGRFTEIISAYLENNDRVRQIIAEVTKDEKPEGWCGMRALCAGCGRIDRGRIVDWDVAATQVRYVCSCGHGATADYSLGEVKLDWRLDWPARWAVHGVTVEPFGKDHGASGGSYDSGRRFCKEVLAREPPEPVLYEWLNDKDGAPFSSSRGNIIHPGDLLRAAAPEIIRYFIVNTRPKKAIRFDPGAGLMDLYRDYERIETTLDEGQEVKNVDRRNYEFSQAGEPTARGVHVAYRNLVSLLQISGGDHERLKGMLVRAGYEKAVEDWEHLAPKIRCAENWIDLYAPPETKMEIKEEIPDAVADLDPKLKKFLTKLSELFVGEVPDAEMIHNSIYLIAKEEMDLDPKEAFAAIYTTFIGQKRGPRAGWLLHSLEPEFVEKRLREAGAK